MEIWSKENWIEFYKNSKDLFEKNAEKILGGPDGGPKGE
jgi:DNA-binding transcriptional regulator/RsmH inhibitor MraZ